MKKTRIDYRGLRLSNITHPQYRHLLLLLGWVGYFVLYALTENLIPMERCHVIRCALDDRIPFCESFAVFYIGWYGLIPVSLGYFLLYDVSHFKKLQTYIILVQMLATVVFVVYPSRHELRPEQFPRENFLTAAMQMIYRIDTPTGVCPSLHVAISLGIASAWYRANIVPFWIRMGIILFCLGVCMSVAFVKQHSVIDIVAAIPICLIAEWFVFGCCYKNDNRQQTD